ncbi:MAG: hypothetical protein H6719_19535 [Sandaracinaceae bacterium]|nr:hypothetical protein [Sandaracinaceae bacterium]
MSRERAFVGVADHNGWAILVTATGDATFVDRRRVELVEEGLPCMPYHHDAQRLPTPDAVALVERVAASAKRCAEARLEELDAGLPGRIAGIALRVCPALPPTIEERLADYFAQNNADPVMYRTALAEAAIARGWRVCWYRKATVHADASEALGADLDAVLSQLGASLGPPWQKDHRMAMAAAVLAARGLAKRAPNA